MILIQLCFERLILPCFLFRIIIFFRFVLGPSSLYFKSQYIKEIPKPKIMKLVLKKYNKNYIFDFWDGCETKFSTKYSKIYSNILEYILITVI
jgi:hypothetical protein